MSTTWERLTEVERRLTMNNMDAYGGGFCRALVGAMYLADSGNLLRIATAFDHLIERYQPSNWNQYVQDPHQNHNHDVADSR